jgi:hypothetical protein
MTTVGPGIAFEPGVRLAIRFVDVVVQEIAEVGAR